MQGTEYLTYNEQLETEEWLGLRLKIIKRDGGECSMCGRKEHLNVHHKYYTHGHMAWEYPENALITLCGKCHFKLHEVSDIVVYGGEDKRKIMNYTPCKRCNGTGYFPQYRHIQNGICFRCGGARYEELIEDYGDKRFITEDINVDISNEGDEDTRICLDKGELDMRTCIHLDKLSTPKIIEYMWSRFGGHIPDCYLAPFKDGETLDVIDNYDYEHQGKMLEEIIKSKAFTFPNYEGPICKTYASINEEYYKDTLYNIEDQVLIKSFAFDSTDEYEKFDIKVNTKIIADKAFAREFIVGDSMDYWSGAEIQCFDLPTGLLEIGESAFENSILKSLFIPKNVKRIGHCITGGCQELYSIAVDAHNKTYDSRDNCNAIIETDSDCLIAACPKTIIPSSIKKLAAYCFSYLNMQNLRIPEGVTDMEDNAINGCKIDNLYLPSTLKDFRSNMISVYLCDTSGISTLYVPKDLYERYSDEWDKLHEGVKHIVVE